MGRPAAQLSAGPGDLPAGLEHGLRVSLALAAAVTLVAALAATRMDTARHGA
ncbi:hypothetical protein ACWDZ8_29580 [Streptomyces sp. NPDC003233]